ncbi:tryptophan-rich sensory protein [Arundinibacter roseus]|uniref:Tryptophan-rich sensory protein n=1 Tax=Arundinibacter roseus TaxID=2070510 RepID=A0A4R4KJJ2_9BACT|nr:tryptophan-rich sensory protein [Arundinibacter roseus]TDB67066.1 tryptophan-rich sensory protein [Arundinibacter roseus]
MKTYIPESHPDATTKGLQIANIICLVVMITANFLANWLPINGNTTGELSAKYPNVFVPAGLTFSIWSIIYLLLIAFTIYQSGSLFSSKPSARNTIVRYVGVWFWASSLLNALWIVVWHYEIIPASLGVMLLLLMCLIFANSGFYNLNDFLSPKERFLTKAPFGVYLGWISVATIANATAWLVGLRWTSGFEQDTWAIIMILIGFFITIFAATRLVNGYISLAVAWAFTGIVIKRLQSDPLFYTVALVAGLGAVLLLIYSIFLIRKDQHIPQRQTEPKASDLYS